MLVTLESLINDNISNNEIVDMESLEFDIVDTMMECSDIERDICTCENALTISNTLQMENQKDNIFKRLIDSIKAFFKRIGDFIKRVINTITYKFDKRSNDKKYNKLIDKIKESGGTSFSIDLNQLATEMYDENLTGKNIDNIVSSYNDFSSECVKLLDRFEKSLSSNDEQMIQTILDEFNELSNTFADKNKSNPICIVLGRFNDNNERSESEGLFGPMKRYDFESKRITLSKDGLIKRVEWYRNIQLSVNNFQETYSMVDTISKKFNNVVDKYQDRMNDYIKLVRSILHQLNESLGTVWTVFYHIKHDDVKNIENLFKENK